MAKKTRSDDAALDKKVKQVVEGFQALDYLQQKIGDPKVHAALVQLDPLIDMVVGTPQDVIDSDIEWASKLALDKDATVLDENGQPLKVASMSEGRQKPTIYFVRLAHHLTSLARAHTDSNTLHGITELLHGVTHQIAMKTQGHSFAVLVVDDDKSLKWLRETAEQYKISSILEDAQALSLDAARFALVEPVAK